MSFQFLGRLPASFCPRMYFIKIVPFPNRLSEPSTALSSILGAAIAEFKSLGKK
jgi:hypothetical protein